MMSGIMEIILKSKEVKLLHPVEDQKSEVDQEWLNTGHARLLISHKH